MHIISNPHNKQASDSVHHDKISILVYSVPFIDNYLPFFPMMYQVWIYNTIALGVVVQILSMVGGCCLKLVQGFIFLLCAIVLFGQVLA
ncbi:MAG TPA: hypothetical protein EYH36_08430 [Desulfocapsa sulfexigens]|nr:hypothetical protein [Desulfocapsa sulfexigens]